MIDIPLPIARNFFNVFFTLIDERLHADDIFNAKFSALLSMCSETKELGYDLLWQGAA